MLRILSRQRIQIGHKRGIGPGQRERTQNRGGFTPPAYSNECSSEVLANGERAWIALQRAAKTSRRGLRISQIGGEQPLPVFQAGIARRQLVLQDTELHAGGGEVLHFAQGVDKLKAQVGL